LYSPEDIGLFAVFGAALGIITIISSLHYELAIPLPKEDKVAFNLLGLAITVVLVIGMILTVSLIFGGERLLVLARANELHNYLWLFPISFLVFGVTQALTFWALRKKAFHATATSTSLQGIGMAVPQVGLGFLNIGVLGLLVGQITGQILSACVLLKSLFRSDHHKITIKDMCEVAITYRRFPLFASWSSLINMLSAQLPVLMLSYAFGPHITGFYALSYRVLQAPMRFVGQSVSQVFFSAAADANLEGRLTDLTLRAFEKLIRISMPCFITIYIIAPELFALCFGKPWIEAGVYSQLLMPWFLLLFLSTPLSMLVSILQQQSKELVFQAAYLAVVAACFALGGHLNDSKISITLFGIFGGLCLLVKVGWLLVLTRNSIATCVRLTIKEILLVMPFGALIYATKSFYHSDLLVSLTGFVCLLMMLVINFKLRGPIGNTAQ